MFVTYWKGLFSDKWLFTYDKGITYKYGISWWLVPGTWQED